MTKLSVTIIARNEAKYLVKCINSVRTISDDIVVVVDSLSTDTTLQLAKKYADTVSVRKFVNFASQKNAAVAQAKHPWILAMDADETISPALAEEILTTLKSPAFHAYTIPRINYLFGRAIMHTNWAPSQHTQVWLFDKNFAHWEGIVHEHIITSQPSGHLSGVKLHINFDTVEDFIAHTNQYSSLEAQTKHWPRVMLAIYPLWKFIRHYVVYQGYLDGAHGFYLSYLMALHGLCVVTKSCLSSS